MNNSDRLGRGGAAAAANGSVARGAGGESFMQFV
jgi:hypothetical protein